ncbi:hypothetical protein O1611_g5264 [Lasiodiplodia mahajangana]|uniref:Uncharacterized protein n=1 Tax=Lasiodiplodia mahajangana TaxID=1108764 RepID=A0ACC2JLN3_9PEZI|nr:hypothetical protein O1611_g5264 [Lasiodiplodia mahajangana]
MYRRLMTSSALLVVVLAFLLDRWVALLTPNIPQLAIGRNNSVLFLTNSEHGLSNVFVATAYALLDLYPEIEVHYASFEQMAARIERVSNYAVRKTPSTENIIFHELPGPSFLANMVKFGKTLTDAVHPPGVAGATVVSRDMSFYVSPWSGEDHIRIYSKAADIINEVDPALVVLDAFLRPAIDATRNCSRLHAFMSPLTPIESFPLVQPYLGWLWKYPVMGSGIPYPIPMLRMSQAKETARFLKSRGITDRISWFNIHRANVPWLTQALPGASTPLDVIPSNVTFTGPILLTLSPAEEQSPELVKWLARAPTMLINLGSLYSWPEGQAASIHTSLETCFAIFGKISALETCFGSLFWETCFGRPVLGDLFWETCFGRPVLGDLF